MAGEYNSAFTGAQIDTALGKVGTAQLNTTAQNLSGAVNELNTGLTLAESSITSYVVGNTNTTGVQLDPGTYVWVKGHSVLSDGLYTVGSTAIVSGGSVVDTNMNAVSVGGLNDLRNTFTTSINNINSKIGPLFGSTNGQGVLTIQLPSANTTYAFIFSVYNKIYIGYVFSATELQVYNVVTGNQLSVTNNSNFNFTISGLDAYAKGAVIIGL